MKVGIMQPYFLPFQGYFSLIKEVDLFILLDDVQFIRHGWVERNRILKPQESWQYIKVPLVKHSRETKIKDIKISYNEDWRNKVLAQIVHYKKRAPFYREGSELLTRILNNEFSSITELNFHSLSIICDYLGIKTPIKVYSNMNLSIDVPKEPDEWALNICSSLEGASQYINAKGGCSFFDKEKYHRKGLDIKFISFTPQPYDQKRTSFESGLSILDALLFCSPKEVRELIDNYELFEN